MIEIQHQYVLTFLRIKVQVLVQCCLNAAYELVKLNLAVHGHFLVCPGISVYPTLNFVFINEEFLLVEWNIFFELHFKGTDS